MNNIRPFSFQDKNTISELLESMGYQKELTPINLKRYSTIDDQIIALTTKKPISIGVKLNIPFEVCSFNYSYLIKPRIISNTSLEQINFIATNLIHIAENLVFEHTLPIESKKREFVQLLNSYMPESFSGMSERQWLTRVRVSILNKYTQLFQSIETDFYDGLIKALNSVGLVPTWDLPPSLKQGIPKSRRDLVLFLSNPDGNEYCILEKGYMTFIRDFELNNIRMRCFFESYNLLLLESIFKDEENISIKDLVLSWIRFIRMSFNPLVNVLDSEYINSSEFYNISIDKLFENDLVDCAFPIPALTRERLGKDELIDPKSELLTKPPISFDEIAAIAKYDEALKLQGDGKIPDAIKAFTKLLITFNKYRQKIGVLKVLFKLAEIGSSLRKYNDSINYLKNALEICKSGNIPMKYIVQTHEKIGNIYLKNKDYINAENHFKIINKFLISQDPEMYKPTIQMVRLKIAKAMVESGRYKDASLLFKKITKDGIEKMPEVQISYYIERSNYFEKKESISNAMQELKKGCLTKDVSNEKLALCHYELGRLFIYARNNGTRASGHLMSAEKLLDDSSNDNLFLKVKIFETLADAFNKMKEFDSMKFYMDQARQIRKILEVKGLY